ncbi:M6 family metalloprotease domain-containing protein [Longimicrobium sp.]|uniref:M6 family metalloprotease domain-containing protein n=1 Tax=Longimicrobium sp. TaxID=2029185 RepID=UPI003B3A66BC
MKQDLERLPGLNDGIIVPGDHFPAGTSLEVVRSTALERAPLRGSVRVVVVLVEFSDRQFDTRHGAKHFEELFFSRGKVAEGSVREYFTEVSNGEIDVIGEVVGPYRLPRTLAEYANGASGTGAQEPNARTMARHAAEAANKDVDFKPYDNDGNGFVDAFIVVHAGAGGESTGSGGDIWSHKWVLANGEYNADGTRIYAYLTVPEDACIGVCCHELGHLLFGWPDLDDT